MSERVIPEKMQLATAELYLLQDTVGTDVCFGVAYPPGRVFGLSSDDNSSLWNVVFDLAEPAPWPVVYRSESFGESLEWLAAWFDDDPATAELAEETVCIALVNSASLEAYVRSADGFNILREEFDNPGTVSEQLGDVKKMLFALDEPIAESRLG